jgi:hypothetical protein
VHSGTRSTNVFFSCYAMWIENWCPWIDNVQEALKKIWQNELWVKAVYDDDIATDTLHLLLACFLPKFGINLQCSLNSRVIMWKCRDTCAPLAGQHVWMIIELLSILPFIQSELVIRLLSSKATRCWHMKESVGQTVQTRRRVSAQQTFFFLDSQAREQVANEFSLPSRRWRV